MNHSLEIYIELYKRGEYAHIAIGDYPDGTLFYPTPKQVKALELLNDDITTIVGYGGSARSGKTIIECTAIIMECLAYDGIAWGLARKELTTLKKTVLLTLFKQMNFYNLNESDYKYNQIANEIRFTNGSTIFLIDSSYKPSDPLNTRFGGFELTRCAIDESNETAASVVLKLFERTGWRLNDQYGLKRKTFECFNPAKNHIYTRFYTPFRDKIEPDHKKFILALPADNPHPSVKEWIDDIIATGDKITIERQIYGNFEYDDDPSALCDYDAICDMFTNSHIKRGDHKYISTDLAMQGRDRFVAGFWRGMICNIKIDKERAGSKEIETDIRTLKDNDGVRNSHIVSDSDGLGAYLEGYINNIKEFHGGSSARNKKEYYNLKAECGYKLAEVINTGKIYVICSKEQEERIKDEISTCLKRDNVDKDEGKKRLISKDKMKILLGRSPDYMDMLLMRMVYEVKKTGIRSSGIVKN